MHVIWIYNLYVGTSVPLISYSFEHILCFFSNIRYLGTVFLIRELKCAIRFVKPEYSVLDFVSRPGQVGMLKGFQIEYVL